MGDAIVGELVDTKDDMGEFSLFYFLGESFAVVVELDDGCHCCCCCCCCCVVGFFDLQEEVGFQLWWEFERLCNEISMWELERKRIGMENL